MINNITAQWQVYIDPKHPVFAGHFPQEPVWPGVYLLAEALRKIASLQQLEIIEHYTIEQVKYSDVVKPGDQLNFTLAPVTTAVPDKKDNADIMAVTIENQSQRRVAKFTLTLPITPAIVSEDAK